MKNNKNYGAIAIKYNCSYQQARNWVIKYEEMGSNGLEDRRGRRVGSLPSRSLKEEFRDKISELERKNQDLQMENDPLIKSENWKGGIVIFNSSSCCISGYQRVSFKQRISGRKTL